MASSSSSSIGFGVRRLHSQVSVPCDGPDTEERPPVKRANVMSPAEFRCRVAEEDPFAPTCGTRDAICAILWKRVLTECCDELVITRQDVSAHINGQAPQAPQAQRFGGSGRPVQAPRARRVVRDDFERLCELFRSAGWDVEVRTRASQDTLVFRIHEGEARCGVQEEVSRELSDANLEGNGVAAPREGSPCEDAKCTGVISPDGFRRRIGKAVTEEPPQDVIDEVLEELLAGMRPGQQSVCVRIFEGPNKIRDAEGKFIPNPAIRSAWDTVRVFFATGWNVHGQAQRAPGTTIMDGCSVNNSAVDLVFPTRE